MASDNKLKVLDCTLRDGGYYTNWDFDKNLVDNYCLKVAELPIDYIEIGYRNKLINVYCGEYFYLPEVTLKSIKQRLQDKKIAVMLNAKDTKENDIPYFIGEIQEYINLVRIAVTPDNINEAIKLILQINNLGLESAVNIMYISKLDKDDVRKISTDLSSLGKKLSYVYLVDSYGGIFPDKLAELIRQFKNNLAVPLGFHGHNNMELAFANTLTAIEEGVEIIDATVLGMGRGAGNLKTELILSYLESKGIKQVNYNSVSQLVTLFQPLLDKYKWGTNFAYMIAGGHSLPQKSVMDLMSKRRYEIQGIVLALEGMKLEDKIKLKPLEVTNVSERVIIFGGGTSIDVHERAISTFIQLNPDVTVIYASSRSLKYCEQYKNPSYLCLTGNEALKLDEKQLSNITQHIQTCIYPPSPRKLGTYVPNKISKQCFELSSISFTDKNTDSPLALGLEASIKLKAKHIYLTGFDGYTDGTAESFSLNRETQEVINEFLKLGIRIESLTPSNYENLDSRSVYGL